MGRRALSNYSSTGRSRALPILTLSTGQISRLARAGCKTFFVADVAEARTVRASARAATIYVLHGFTLECADRFVELDARPVINSMTELAEWDTFAAARGLQSGAALHV